MVIQFKSFASKEPFKLTLDIDLNVINKELTSVIHHLRVWTLISRQVVKEAWKGSKKYEEPNIVKMFRFLPKYLGQGAEQSDGVLKKKEI